MKGTKAVLLFCVGSIVLFSFENSFASGYLTLPFEGDYEPNCGFYCYENHGGNDYPLPQNTIVLASEDGTAMATYDESAGSYGRMVTIDHGESKATKYAHLEAFIPSIVVGGDAVQVKRGQVIGYSGNSGGPWLQSDGTYRSPYHLHFEVRESDIRVDPYNANDWLWTTNPPSHAYFGTTIFDFTDGSSEGMTANWCMSEAPLAGVDEWRVQVDNTTDPGVDSPAYPDGLLAKDVVIEFSAKVLNGGNPVSEGKVYVRDGNGHWNEENRVSLQLINDEVGYNNGEFASNDYNVYRAVLSDLPSNDIEMSQFSIQLTDGLSTSETWTFDLIKVLVLNWDFVDTSIGWSIRQNGELADFYVNNWWRINPTNTRTQVESPIAGVPKNATKIGIRYSIRNATSERLAVFFDTGSGYSTSCYAQETVNLDPDNNLLSNDAVVVKFVIPDCAKDGLEGVMFDLFDNPNYSNMQIAIDEISFLSSESNTSSYTVTPEDQFLSSSSGGSDGDYFYFGSTMTSDVSGGYPVSESNTFYSGDAYAGIWLELQNIYDSLNVTWKWYKPDGSLYGECTHITDWPTNVSWSSIKLSRFMDLSGLTDYGQWRVDIYVNGTKIDAQYFSFSEVGSDGGSTTPPDPEPIQAPIILNITIVQ